MSELVADFHKLERRLRLAGTLTTRTALRIGSSGGGVLDAVDLPVLRDAGGYPFIPGSSLKGVLRSTIEALVRGAAHRPETGLWACDPLIDKEGAEVACGFHKQGERGGVKVEEHCAVCRLFGSHVVASHARFSDAMLSKAARERGRAPVEVRDGVAIDRDLRVASGARKYDFEVVSPGTSFAVEVFVENPKPWLMGLLALGFDQLAAGFTAIGGFTSRGLGRVELVWSELTEVTARELLDGKKPQSIAAEALVVQQNVWRQALAERARGGA